MHIFSGFAFRSPLHPRAPRNLRARPPRAMRSVGLDSGTLWTAYSGVCARSGRTALRHCPPHATLTRDADTLDARVSLGPDTPRPARFRPVRTKHY